MAKAAMDAEDAGFTETARAMQAVLSSFVVAEMTLPVVTPPHEPAPCASAVMEAA
ncbi:hypothetical protein [Pseudoroseicyclus aestuarii]|uniref:Uncharacterized protein n=1 Tax=Pseudoroseicyclus aestuarii TaxID=1795041 RepID=A0A318ST98_9RHOB|nr:hypothetical protein [Pseudoroseicyclus aestuarii]PYE82389.1 hypothetical protein DFP88_104145 [Pseudoroseicyclus aestuarii]